MPQASRSRAGSWRAGRIVGSSRCSSRDRSRCRPASLRVARRRRRGWGTPASARAPARTPSPSSSTSCARGPCLRKDYGHGGLTVKSEPRRAGPGRLDRPGALSETSERWQRGRAPASGRSSSPPRRCSQVLRSPRSSSSSSSSSSPARGTRRPRAAQAHTATEGRERCVPAQRRARGRSAVVDDELDVRGRGREPSREVSVAGARSRYSVRGPRRAAARGYPGPLAEVVTP